MTQTKVHNVGGISFHGDRPHYDELSALCVAILLGVVRLNFDTVHVQMDNSIYIQNPDLAWQHFTEGVPGWGGKVMIFLGWTPWEDPSTNPFDEHEGGTQTERLSSAVHKLQQELGGKLNARLRLELYKLGFQGVKRDRAVENFHRMVAIDDLKDRTSTARPLGPSRLQKDHVYVTCFQIQEDDALKEGPYQDKHVRRALQRTWQTLLNTLFMPELRPGINTRVENLVLKVLQRYFDHPEANKARTLMELYQNAPRKTRRELELLMTHMVNMRNTGSYTSDAWFIQQSLLMRPHLDCPIPVPDDATVESFHAQLLAAKAPEALVSSIESRLEGGSGHDALKKVRSRRREQQAWQDENHWSCPLAFHHQVSRMLIRESLGSSGRRRGEGEVFGWSLGLRRGSAEQFVEETVSILMGARRLTEHAERELKAVRKTAEIEPLVRTEEGASPFPGRAIHMRSINPLLTSVLRNLPKEERFGVSLITDKARGAACIAIDHDRLTSRQVNTLYRRMAVLLRALEYRARNLPVPDDLNALTQAGKADDDVWYLHVLPHNGMARNLMAVSIFHRDSKPSLLDAGTIARVVQVVWTTTMAEGRKVRQGTERWRRMHDARFSHLHVLTPIFAALRDSATLEAAQQQLEQIAKRMPDHFVLAT